MENENGYVTKTPSKSDVEEYATDHKFTAEYLGTSFHKCMGRTARCPEECGHSGDLAKFKVINYESLTGKGQARRDKLTSLDILVSDFNKQKLQKDYIAYIENLLKGDKVKFHIKYIYDTSKSNVFTEEKIMSIKKL